MTREPASGDTETSREAADPTDATRIAPSPAASLVGRVLRQRFVLEAEIGRGGMGTVYRARDLLREEARDRDRHVAIKVISGDLGGRADALTTLQREAKRAQQLAHPNIATVYDFDRDGEVVYLCMELLSGRSLGQVLAESDGSGMDWERALPIIRDMAEGLAYAHARGVIHADFKPGNVFLTEAGTAKILDFGIARVIPDPDSGTATRFDGGAFNALTPAYASCEMFEGAAPDPRDDVYGLACVSYELLTGAHPFDRLPAPRARAAGRAPAPVRGIGKRRNRALVRALSFDREPRTPDARTFLDELSAPAGRSRWPASVAAALALAALGGASIVWWRSPGPTESESQPVTRPATATLTTAPPLDEVTRGRIERILEAADLHLAVGRLAEPESSNAAAAYAEAAALDPGNPRAVAGLLEVARALQAAGRDQQAREVVALGLRRVPGQSDLELLQRRLRADPRE